MPLPAPPIDTGRYQQILDELLARVPVHTPDWTNFNHSDPGVTLVQLYAFLAESLRYRFNLVPDRNRAKFLALLGQTLAPAAAAQGLVTISNDQGPLQTVTLQGEIELRAGDVPFRTQLGLDVLPIEARAYFKRAMPAPDPTLRDYYTLLYASYQKTLPLQLALYQTVAFDGTVVPQLDLKGDTVDGALWIALLGRQDDAGSDPADPWRAVRTELAGRTITLGIVPVLTADQAELTPGNVTTSTSLLAFEMPLRAPDGTVPRDPIGQPAPTYRTLDPRADADVLTRPGLVQLGLPAAAEIGTFAGLDPLEAGVGDLPPALDDAAVAGRVVTWLRIRATTAAVLLWVGANAARVTQLERIVNESLAVGDGTPGQIRQLARSPVLPGSVTVETWLDGAPRAWTEIDDLTAAGPEVPVRDDRLAPGVQPAPPAPTDVFTVDAEAGRLQWGDGVRGRRLTLGASVFASYAVCQGAAGNVAPGAIATAPTLPAGLSVTNAVRTWGGADAETPEDGQRQVQRRLQHGDRLVSPADFEAIAWRTPGVDIGRIDVLAAFHPDLAPNEPGDAPGVVTLMAIPRVDSGQPDAPRADRIFLNAICDYLDPRRLVTTELILRGANYKGIWISVGIDVASGYAIADVTDAVRTQLRAFLSPLPPDGGGFAAQAVPLFAAPPPAGAHGWPLRTPVASRVLLAEAARVQGVVSVADVLLAEGTLAPADTVDMTGLELPRVLGIAVVSGDPMSIAALRGDAAASPAPAGPALLPVPVIPETC